MFKSSFAIFTIVLTIASVLLLSSPTTAHAQSALTFRNPVNISNDSGKAQYPNVQSVGEHVYVAWTEGNRGIKFRTSSDGGLTWTPPLIDAPLNISTGPGGTQYPMISANGSYVYIAWSQLLESSGLQLMFAVSSNYGVSFNPPQIISPQNSQDKYDTPVLASQGNDVYVGYNDNSQYSSWVIASSNNGKSWTSPYSDGNAHEPQVYAWGQNAYIISDAGFAYSTNNGQNWQNSGPSGCCGSEPWIWGYGSNVYTAWETKGNGSQIYVASSNNNAERWSQTTQLTSVLPDSWAPMIWAYGNTAWIAERDYPGGRSAQVWMYTTGNGGSNWNSPVSLSGNGTKGSAESFPYTVASSDGQNVFAAWSHQVSSGYWTFMVSYSSNGGSSWSSPPGYNVSGNPNGEAGMNTDIATGAISAYGANCYAAWQFINGTRNQIYFSAS